MQSSLVRGCLLMLCLLGVWSNDTSAGHYGHHSHCHGGPSFSFGFYSAPPVYYAPPPMYVAPSPYYVPAPPAYVPAAPVYYYPAPAYYNRGVSFYYGW